MIRIILPHHLRTLAKVASEVQLEIAGPATQRSVLDALETRYPMLRGTIRDQVTGQRRPFLRFFACEEDLSHQPPDTPLPDAVISRPAGAIGRGAIFCSGIHAASSSPLRDSQPTVRGIANSTVNISGLKPIAWYMMPE
jgi:molybdopterin synthase sulfur carrier subunit